MELKTRDELVKELSEKLNENTEIMDEIALPGVIQHIHDDK